MELIYTTRRSGFEAGKAYRNPRYFTVPDHNATRVLIEGDYPAIREAYEALGVIVSDDAISEPTRDLRAEYELLFGRKPAGRMKAQTMLEAIEEARRDQGNEGSD